VISRKAGHEGLPGVKWESTAEGTFTVEEVGKEHKGTDVIVHLRDGEEKYLEEGVIRSIVRKYSDFIEHPIVMEVEKVKESELKKGETYTAKEEETLNSMKALWLRDRSEVPDTDYDAFYRHLSHDSAAPLRVIRFKAEGTTEFTALLFIPAHRPFDIFLKEFKIGPALYVKKVQIMDHCEDLMPPYLRFVKGVVDSPDLPLNISREMLQSSHQAEVIRKSITKKILDTLAELKKHEHEKYLAFYREFGTILKEGIHYDLGRRDAIAELLLFETASSEPRQLIALSQYVGSMKEGQDAIYYILGTSRDEIAKSPYLEALREKAYDVLLMTDEIDAYIVGGLPEYQGKPLKSVTRGDIAVDKDISAQRERARTEFGRLIDAIREHLRDEVKDVRLSGRLRDSACCLVSDDADLDPTMERLLHAMGRGIVPQKRILEINPAHPLLSVMNEAFEKDRESTLVREYAGLLYDQALLLEGSRPKDPVAFARTVSELMLGNAYKRLHGG
ncbi:MAG: molecular chaperone HtpG, partial [Thermodesulfovibrionales bacterium]